MLSNQISHRGIGNEPAVEVSFVHVDDAAIGGDDEGSGADAAEGKAQGKDEDGDDDFENAESGSAGGATEAAVLDGGVDGVFVVAGDGGAGVGLGVGCVAGGLAAGAEKQEFGQGGAEAADGGDDAHEDSFHWLPCLQEVLPPPELL